MIEVPQDWSERDLIAFHHSMAVEEYTTATQMKQFLSIFSFATGESVFVRPRIYHPQMEAVYDAI